MRRYYEFALLVVIISLLAVILMQALNGTRRDMEEASVQAEAASLRLQLLERLVHRETYGGRLPDSKNPLDWIANPPANYVGVVDQVPETSSVWFFLPGSEELVYRFADGHLARFRLTRDGQRVASGGGLAGAGLQRIE